MLLDAINEIIGAMADPVPPNFIGNEFLSQEDAPPRIVWDPKDEIGFAPFKGGRMGSLEDPTPPGQRALRTRICKVDVHIWGAGEQPSNVFGADWIAVEQLLENFINAVHVSSVGFYEFKGGQWDRMKELIRLGRVYTAMMEFRIPVPELPAPTLATITSYTLTTELDPPT